MTDNKQTRTPSPRAEAPNAAQLRDAIDSGLAGDKLGFPDPAAAPLGTDDEAAGTPESPEQVAAAQKAEVPRRAVTPGRVHAGRGHAGRAALAGLAALVLIALALWLVAGL